MRAISSGLAGGSSLALGWKALQLLDRPSFDPSAVAALCSAASSSSSLDWFSFSLGIAFGVLLFAFVEFVVTCRWLVRTVVESHFNSGVPEPPRREKPLFKIL